MPFGIMNHLDVKICKDVDEAIRDGHVYKPEDGYKAVEIERVVVIQNGTEAGNSTVDIILKDEQGNKFVVMVTGKLLNLIPC